MEKVIISKDLLEIKDAINKPVKIRSYNNELDQLVYQLKELNEKVDEIRSNVSKGNESVMKLKRKKEIIYILKSKGKITTLELSELMRLSRTRCSEYLNEMEKEGIIKSERKNKKKFYGLNL